MHRSSPALAVSVFLTAFLFVTSASAQSAPAAQDTCEPVRRALEASVRAGEEAHRNTATAAQESAECKQELAGVTERLQHTTTAAKSCQSDKEHLCSATAAFVDELARGQSRGASDTGCVSREQQTRLDGMLAGWSNATSWLSQLAAYESGESDTLARPRAGATPIERLLARLAREGSTHAHQRRLLIEALEIIAPQAWRALRARGATAIDEWFADTKPLDAEIVAEAKRAEVAPGSAPRSLTGAMHLVRAYEIAADCATPGTTSRGCGRGRQLQQLLESTGSLVVLRRVQDIWATECSAVSADATAPWLDDIPTPHLGDSSAAWNEIAAAAHAKLFGCYLGDSGAHATYLSWLASVLPPPGRLTATRLTRVHAIESQWNDASADAACLRAVRAMQTMATPATCELPSAEFRDALGAWSDRIGSLPKEAGEPLRACAELARVLWEGKTASVPDAFARPPSVDEMTVVDKDAAPTAMARLRTHCGDRRGDVVRFGPDLAALAEIARGFGEATDQAPFRVDPATSRPVEAVRADGAQGTGPWLSHVARGASACSVIGLTDERCRRCAEIPANAAYDCALVGDLEDNWARRTRSLAFALLLTALTIAAALWARRFRLARRAYAPWARDTAAFFDGIGLASRVDRFRNLLPSRYDTLELSLPSEPAWERWGTRAIVVRTPPGAHVGERDVNHAAFVARRLGASVVLLEHDDAASPDLSAVRAQLEWAAKGGSRAVQILPIAEARARWSKSALDVLDLVEESSLRGNPFELRGRIATSTQFFNRERLVSGLLAAAQAGHWMVLTGLRRFGKSSLALEVARRLPGPAAYVDLSGFDHEVRLDANPAEAASTILRYVCLRLVESARARWPAEAMPAPPPEGSAIDAATLTLWFRDLSRACRVASGRPSPLLVVLDEIEQTLAIGPKRLAHALDVLAIVIGRLKSAGGDAALPDGGSSMGVFLASAMHPLLWAPLRTLAHQSIMSSCQRVCVPCMDEEASTTMMRSLGARQGIRFTDASLGKLVGESQGVALLLRRLGASILELYDAERARQGSLGAVEVGIEGATEAMDREAREGSPLRVWIESEIAPRRSVAGALLRCLSASESVPSTTLCEIAKRMIAEDFVCTGIDQTLESEELERRAEEAAHVMVQLLGESGLLTTYGDLTAPEGYSLPEGAIRRVLRAQENVSA